MSNLQTQIRDDMKTAMKAHDKQRTGTLRMFLAALTTEETSGARHKLDDDEVLNAKNPPKFTPTLVAKNLPIRNSPK